VTTSTVYPTLATAGLLVCISTMLSLVPSFCYIQRCCVDSQAVPGGQYGGSPAAVTPNCYAGTAPSVSSTIGAPAFQLDAYACPASAVTPGPLRGGSGQQIQVQSSSGGMYRRPAPYPSPQQYMLAKRTPFFYQQHCSSNAAYAVSCPPMLCRG